MGIAYVVLARDGAELSMNKIQSSRVAKIPEIVGQNQEVCKRL